MGIGIDRLTAKEVDAFARGRHKSGKTKLFDGLGLYLTKTPAGACVWRLAFRFPDETGTVKERVFAIGQLGDYTLEEARAQRAVVRKQIQSGVDPVQARQLQKAKAAVDGDTTFRSVADQWFAKMRREWSGIHYEKATAAFERDVYPIIGKLPIELISSDIVGDMVKRVLARDVVETAQRELQHVRAVFRYAKALGIRKGENPASDASEFFPKKKTIVPRPALLDIERLRDVLRRADLAPISPAVRLAQRLCAFSACRLGNVVGAEWAEFDLESDVPTWTIPRAKMKVRDRAFDHVVFLGPTIASELRVWQRMTGGRGYVFASTLSKGATITRETVEKVYRVTLGLSRIHSLHGWRASFSTLAKDSEKFNHDAVELSLDHIHDTAVARAYDRGERRDERIRLATWWDAMLNPTPIDVIPLVSRVAS